MGITVRPLRPLTRAAELELSSASSFTFAVVGDCQPVLPRMPFSRVTHDVMRELRLLRPAFVLYTGDRIWGYRETRQEMLNTFDRFRALADTTGVPFFAVLGNHEMQSDPAAVAVVEEVGSDFYGSFDAGRYHFVALNTDEVNLEGRLTGEQLDWLRSDLALSRDAAGIFVFMHRPLFSWFQGDFNPDDAAELQLLFGSHPVRCVFAGHDHLYYEEVHDGIRYITTGGGGGTVYAQPPRGGFAHYLLVHVADDDVGIDVIEPGHLEVHYVSGNDGLEPVSRARIVNTTERRLLVRNLELRVPRLGSPDRYRLSADYIEFDGTRVELDPVLRDVLDNGDGSVTLAVQVPVADGSAFYITAEALHR